MDYTWLHALVMVLLRFGTSPRTSVCWHYQNTYNLVMLSVYLAVDHVKCILVWGCSWHSTANILASSSMDQTIRVWDVTRFVYKCSKLLWIIYHCSKRCVLTLRGHGDSVNSVRFVPYSSVLCSSSADRTISLWDCRTVSTTIISMCVYCVSLFRGCVATLSMVMSTPVIMPQSI